MSPTRPPFVDATYAADLLGLQPHEVLEMIGAGRLSTFGGKDKNPFVRMVDVEKIAQDIGRDLSQPPGKRRASQNPVRRIELRIRHDARWSEVSDDDIRAWARGLSEAERAAAIQVVGTTRQRLEAISEALGDQAKASE